MCACLILHNYKNKMHYNKHRIPTVEKVNIIELEMRNIIKPRYGIGMQHRM